jgi:hypothetical protein
MSAQHIRLTDSQVWALVNALRVAADQYQQDARTSPRLSRQFEGQTAQARELADLLEGSDVVIS